MANNWTDIILVGTIGLVAYALLSKFSDIGGGIGDFLGLGGGTTTAAATPTTYTPGIVKETLEAGGTYTTTTKKTPDTLGTTVLSALFPPVGLAYSIQESLTSGMTTSKSVAAPTQTTAPTIANNISTGITKTAAVQKVSSASNYRYQTPAAQKVTEQIVKDIPKTITTSASGNLSSMTVARLTSRAKYGTTSGR